MKFLVSILFVFCFAFQASSQDKLALAQVYFKRAQNSVEKKDNDNAINYLNKSREYFGGIVSEELAIFGANFFFSINKQKEAQEYLKAFFDLGPDKASEAYRKMLSLYTDSLDVIDDPSKFETIKNRKERTRKEVIDAAYARAKTNYAANKFEETISSIETYLSLSPSKTSKAYKELTGILTTAKEKLLLEQQSLYVSLAKNAFTENKFEESISAIEKYFALNPKEASVEFIELTELLQKAKDQLNAPKKVDEPVVVVKDSIIDSSVLAPKKDTIIAVVEPKGSTVYTADLISFMMIQEAPIFPGCTGTNSETKTCFEQQVKGFFTKNFDKNLLDNIGLSKGEKRIFITFEIDTNGAATNLDIKSIDPKVTAEATRVIYMLPKMQPAKLVGKPIGVSYSFLFTFMVK